MAVTILVSSTQGLADSVVAHLVDETSLVVEADVLTELPITHLSVWTLCVCRARLGLFHTTNNWGRVGNEACRTRALRPMVDHLALGVWSARVSNARICATVVDACVRFRTIRVCSTADDTHLVQTDVAKEAVVVNATCN